MENKDKTKKEYRCVKRTKRTFEESLISLSREMPLNKITVKKICEKSELSRNAFYFHYQDINALVEDIENSMIDYIHQIFNEISSENQADILLEIITKLTNYFYEKNETALMLLNSTYSASFTERMNAAFSEFYFEYFKTFQTTNIKDTYDMFYEYLSGGFCGMLIKWLKEGNMPKRLFIRLAFTFTMRLLDVDLK